jgi:hypothetical protein
MSSLAALALWFFGGWSKFPIRDWTPFDLLPMSKSVLIFCENEAVSLCSRRSRDVLYKWQNLWLEIFENFLFDFLCTK